MVTDIFTVIKLKISKYLIPLFYSIAILVIVFYQVSGQRVLRQGTDNPNFRNLMDYPAYVKRGFNPSDIVNVPSASPDFSSRQEWVKFHSPPLRVMNSPLVGLPKRKYLSPYGKQEEEFTILIPVEIDSQIINSHGTSPGIYLGYIGENWEIFLNGKLIKSEMHLDEKHRIKNRRSWQGVYFPVDKSDFLAGTNILAFRIMGDPALSFTGFYSASPYYIDEYSAIEKRHFNILLVIMTGIFCFLGIYYLSIFLAVRKKQESFNLYFGLFSIFLCIYSLMCNGNIANLLFPNSNISIRLEYMALFMMIPMLCFFVEQFGRKRITWISLGFFIFSVLLTLTHFFFCNQYSAEILTIWNILVIVYLSYVFFYSVVYFYFWEERHNTAVANTFFCVLIGFALIYVCGIFDLFNVVILNKNSIRLFMYITFVFQVVMAFTMSKQFRDAHNKSNQFQNALLKTMAELVEYRDDITGRHIGRTQQGLRILIDEMKKEHICDEETKDWNIDILIQSCQLHDIGKISIGDRIIKKPGPLTADEFEDMKFHTIIGRQLIDKIEALAREESDFLKYAKVFAISHHEKWDGTGYPYGLKRSEIPLLGRILAIANVYDALISVRPYKKAYPHEEAVKIITENSGTQFDPALVTAFLNVKDKFAEIS
jgi:biotin transporter BioY